MALDKKGKPAVPARNVKSAPANPVKVNPLVKGLKKIHPNYYYLAFVLLLVLGVGMVVYVYHGTGADVKETKDPKLTTLASDHPYGEPTAGQKAASPEKRDSSSPSVTQATLSPGTTAVTPTVEASPVPTAVPFNATEYSQPVRELKTVVEEYLKKYDQAVQSGNFASLAAWAQDKGLSVEVSRLSRMETLVSSIPTIARNTRWLTYSQASGWQLSTQQEYETQLWTFQMSRKPVQRDYSYRQIAGEMDQIQPGGGMSNQTHLASLLAQADCPKGRELYQKTMKEKGPEFYGVLVRELKKAYLEDAGTEKDKEKSPPTGWINSIPINLWLIEQLIDLTPPKTLPVEADKAKAPSPSGQGQASKGPGGAQTGSGTQDSADQILFEHRLMLLQTLSRRGGEVSAYLMGKLLAADKERLLLTGLVTGKVDSNLFTRFTDIYADPLIDPLIQELEKHKNAQQEWTAVASLMARLLNERANEAVFSSAQGPMLLSGDVVLFMAASGSKSTLTHLSEFIRNSRVQNVDVGNIFSLWTVPTGIGQKTFWDLFGDLLPSGPQVKKDQAKTGEAPGTGLPSAGVGNPGQAVQKSRGWPVNRKFLPAVDAGAGMEFLKLLGQLGTSGGGKAQNPGQGPGPMGPAGASMGGTGTFDLTKIKIDAIRSLVTLYDPKLKEFFRPLIDDPEAGGLSRLALCILDDKDSRPLLLKHFWKAPLELNKSAGSTGNQGNQTEEPTVTAGRISVPLDSLGLPLCGISAREGLIYFDDKEAGKAFLASLGEFITRKDPFDQPEQTANAACRLIEALGRWSVPGSAATLADLIESTGDFGLRGADRTAGVQKANPTATKVRKKALEVLGKIGDTESLEVILRIATYSQEGDELGIAAQIALAKRGYNEAADLFLNMIDPEKLAKTKGTGNETTLISSIDPDLKNKQDIALLGLSKAKLSDAQVTRVITLLKKLGEGRSEAAQALPATLQTDLMISLLTRAQGKVLRGLAEAVGESPPAGGSKTQEGYYWNRNTGETDKCFLKMVQILGLKESFEDEDAVAAFITAILRREEAMLVPANFDPEKWNPKDELVAFEEKAMFRQGSAGMEMPSMTEISNDFGVESIKMPEGIQSRLTPGRERSPQKVISPRETGKEEKRLNFPIAIPRTKNEGRQTAQAQEASLEGITLVSRLKTGKQLLKGMRELPFYRYLANYLLWQTGDPEGGSDLIQLLTEPSESGREKYLKFIALDQMKNFSNFDLVGLLAQAIRKTSDSILRAKIGCIAMAVTAETWQDQLIGKTTLLNDAGRVTRTANFWKSVLDSKTFDYLLANPMVITLAALELHDPVVKWIQDLIRIECNRDTPISEQAVGVAVEILQSLNPKGNDDLLGLYVAILNQTFDPDKQKQALELAEEKEAKAQKGKKTSAAPPSPGGAARGGKRSSGAATPHSAGKGNLLVNKGDGSVFAYVSIAPMIIQAISEMKSAQVLPALVQLSRSRSDVLGLTALEIYKRDKKQGQILIKRLVGESGKNPELKDQAKLVVVNLMMDPDVFAFEVAARAVSKGDATVGEMALTMIIKLHKAEKIPPEVNLVQGLKGMLQNLWSEMQTGRDVSVVLQKALEFAKTFPDKELSRLCDRLKTAAENFKKSNKGSRGTSGGKAIRSGGSRGR